MLKEKKRFSRNFCHKRAWLALGSGTVYGGATPKRVRGDIVDVPRAFDGSSSLFMCLRFSRVSSRVFMFLFLRWNTGGYFFGADWTVRWQAPPASPRGLEWLECLGWIYSSSEWDLPVYERIIMLCVWGGKKFPEIVSRIFEKLPRSKLCPSRLPAVIWAWRKRDGPD